MVERRIAFRSTLELTPQSALDFFHQPLLGNVRT